MPGPRDVSDGQNRKLYVYNGGFLTGRRIRRILSLAGWTVKIGRPGPNDWVGVWGKSPTSPRGEAVAHRTETPVLHVEDTFLRSVHPGRTGEDPIGLCLDQTGVHFDSSGPSDLETLLANHPLDDTALLNRARAASARLQKTHLSKYNAFDPNAPLPRAPYVLVIDQTRDDASIRHGGANAATFAEMLVFAQTEHPGTPVVIKTHPETQAGHRAGHFGPDVENDRVHLLTDPVSPWALMAGATAVYTVSSQLGFESIFAGHRPRVFGQPFYAGWGLSLDENPVPRRSRKLTRAQLFAGAMILYPRWYDPALDRLCDLEDAIASLEARTRAWRQDHRGFVATGMRRWKRPHLDRFFGSGGKIRYVEPPETALATARATGRDLLVWGQTPPDLGPDPAVNILHVEDGFLRSSGLGANLAPPLSLVADDLGLYYDCHRPSRLEELVNASPDLSPDERARAERLITDLRRFNVTKYNLSQATPLPERAGAINILVPGQVEDDASILRGCDRVRTNLHLLETVRAANPDATIFYKPHPDVEAGLRPGRIAPDAYAGLADHVLAHCDPGQAIDLCDQLWTMTSTMGFEALIRGKPVTCLGMPFYAGWGLTTDNGPAPARRIARPDLVGLAHACLIDYPRYYDPQSGEPCPVETTVERLRQGGMPKGRLSNRIAARLQSLFWPLRHR